LRFCDTPLPGERGGGEGVELLTRNKTLPPILENARSLRRNQTEAEEKLWKHLRNRKVGNLKFRRQQPFEGFILDFYCPEAKLSVEVDGEIHLRQEEREYDQQRTEYLADFEIKIIRFSNDSVMNNVFEVLSIIMREADERIIK